MKKKVILIKGGSLKLRVVTRAFSLAFPEEIFEFVSLDSVAKEDQVISKAECLARMRSVIFEAKSNYLDASYFVFMRGRFEDDGLNMEESALVMVQDDFGNEGYSQAASFVVPEKVAQLVRDGISFSKAVEEVYCVPGVKEGSGFVGILTNGVVMKEEQYFQPTAIALSSCIRQGFKG